MFEGVVVGTDKNGTLKIVKLKVSVEKKVAQKDPLKRDNRGDIIENNNMWGLARM
jgi:hypothetical protein